MSGIFFNLRYLAIWLTINHVKEVAAFTETHQVGVSVNRVIGNAFVT